MSDIYTITYNGYYEEKAPLQTTATRYQIDECVVCTNTGFSNTVICKSPDYGMMLFLDNELQSTSYDEAIYHETLVHPIMNVYADLPDKHILVIGGAEGATVREVLKWSSVKILEWVDIDSELVDLCKKHMRFCDDAMYQAANLYHFTDDIMKHLDRITDPTYDIIIIDLPDPDPEMGTPLYGPLFWSLVKRVLKPGGGIVSHTGPVEPGFGRQVGMKMVQSGSGLTGFPYHTLIPSFQGDWGFWMNQAPVEPRFPDGCSVMDATYQKTIFHWDKHWQI